MPELKKTDQKILSAMLHDVDTLERCVERIAETEAEQYANTQSGRVNNNGVDDAKTD